MVDHALIHPVILCGGSGTRLWPASRKSLPKPFLPLTGEQTLFQQAISRASDPAQFAPPMIVAGADHAALIEQQIGPGSDYRVMVEPAARNTAPAIALAAASLDPDAIMLVCPSDHHIADAKAFCAAAKTAAELAKDDWLVAFGIAPERPETGYGYIKRGDALGAGFKVDRFVEKPDLERAEGYVASGDFSWNGGIFTFRAGALMDELARHRPEMAEAVRTAIGGASRNGNRIDPAVHDFATITGESIDYAVMENTARAAMVPVEMGWSDIGNWAALQDALNAADQSGQAGNIAPDSANLIDCDNILVHSDGPRVSAIGLQDVCIIVNGDEVLVTTRAGAQQVGKLPGASNQ
ncbi:MAG: mannose-1-phosphate guanylyltransferase [Erythrobacter sp.]